MILEERTSVYNNEIAIYSDLDGVCQEKYLKNVYSGALS